MKLIQVIVFTLLVMVGSLVMAQPNDPSQPVGSVIFSTGDAYADQVKLRSGSAVYIGQTLSTSNGGHVHIRMIDGAFLSLRSDSSAKVSLYTVDLENPANTQIRIDVKHGVVRSVTGKGGEGNHAAFRLNTPVAAIGIRGTDFIVYTDAVSSVVDLRQGGIEMAPFSDTCSPYALGICGGGESVTLLDRDPGLLAEVNAAHQKATRVSKASAAIVPDKIEPAHPTENQSLKQAKDTPVVISVAPVVAPVAESKSTDGSGKAQTAGTTSTAASENKSIATPVTTTGNEGKVATGATASAPSTLTTVKTATGSVVFVTPANNTPASASSNVAATSAGATVDVASIAPVTAEVGVKESVTSELASRVISQATTEGSIKAVGKEVTSATLPPLPLVDIQPVPVVVAKAQPFYWGRWTSYAENAEQNIVRDPARNKQVFAANTAMLLASSENEAPRLPKTGVTNFKVDKAEAHVLTGGALREASVSNPSLAVNFDQNRFATSLDVSSGALTSGTEHLMATGTLDSNTGVLRSSLAGSNMTISGKVSDEAAHAAYLFNQDSSGIVGAISWDAQ